VIEYLDVVFGLVILAEFAARLFISRSVFSELVHPLGIADIIVILSFLVPTPGENFGCLRVVRALRLYRYYVCLGASRRGHHTCSVRSIAASEVEGLVLGQVRRLLASPELVARTITAVRRENGTAEDAQIKEGAVIEALGALDPVWDELYPAEQARILRLLIERIDVAPDGISVTLHAAGIRSLLAEMADQEAPALAASEPVPEAAE
jgi:hypothetical protein